MGNTRDVPVTSWFRHHGTHLLESRRISEADGRCTWRPDPDPSLSGLKILDPVQSSDAERAVKAAGADNVLPEGRYLQNDFRTIAQVVSLRNARGSGRDTFCVSHAAMTCTRKRENWHGSQSR